MSLKTFVVALSIASAMPLFSQVVPSATENHLRLKIGAGFSDYDGDLRNGRLMGGVLWIDAVPPHLPSSLRGLGLEIEARGVQTQQNAPNEIGVFRQAMVAGGPTYSWRISRSFRPYGKFLAGLAGQNFNIGDQGYHHETQVAFAPGGGVDYSISKNLWVRGEYEYQIWPRPAPTPLWDVNPEGFSVGLLWSFSPLRGR